MWLGQSLAPPRSARSHSGRPRATLERSPPVPYQTDLGEFVDCLRAVLGFDPIPGVSCTRERFLRMRNLRGDRFPVPAAELEARGLALVRREQVARKTGTDG